MREQSVQIDVAKLAKEKGFDWSCNYGINENLKILTSGKGEYVNAYDGFNFNHRYSNEVDNVFPLSIPTQSLLAKWLRDVHKINIYCTPVSTIPGSYEEALEAGLLHGLKLINNG
jgi:hypothetical protein